MKSLSPGSNVTTTLKSTRYSSRTLQDVIMRLSRCHHPSMDDAREPWQNLQQSSDSHFN